MTMTIVNYCSNYIIQPCTVLNFVYCGIKCCKFFQFFFGNEEWERYGMRCWHIVWKALQGSGRVWEIKITLSIYM